MKHFQIILLLSLLLLGLNASAQDSPDYIDTGDELELVLDINGEMNFVKATTNLAEFILQSESSSNLEGLAQNLGISYNEGKIFVEVDTLEGSYIDWLTIEEIIFLEDEDFSVMLITPMFGTIEKERTLEEKKLSTELQDILNEPGEETVIVEIYSNEDTAFSILTGFEIQEIRNQNGLTITKAEVEKNVLSQLASIEGVQFVSEFKEIIEPIIEPDVNNDKEDSTVDSEDNVPLNPDFPEDLEPEDSFLDYMPLLVGIIGLILAGIFIIKRYK